MLVCHFVMLIHSGGSILPIFVVIFRAKWAKTNLLMYKLFLKDQWIKSTNFCMYYKEFSFIVMASQSMQQRYPWLLKIRTHTALTVNRMKLSFQHWLHSRLVMKEIGSGEPGYQQNMTSGMSTNSFRIQRIQWRCIMFIDSFTII